MPLTDPRCRVANFLRRGSYFKRQDGFSHISMDGFGGGMIHVPWDQHSEFLDEIAKDLEMGQPLFLLEAKTAVFRLFVDVDFKFQRPIEGLTDAQLLTFCQILTRVLTKFYPENQDPAIFLMVVCRINADSCFSETGPISKQGTLHVHFPNLWVTEEQAEFILYSLIFALKEEFDGKLEGLANLWEDVIDLAAVKNKTLRMYGSLKCAKCSCSPKDQTCTLCQNGKVNLGRQYQVFWVFVDGHVDSNVTGELSKNFGVALRWCSIQCPSDASPTKGFTRFLDCPVPPQLKLRKTTKKGSMTFEDYCKPLVKKNVPRIMKKQNKSLSPSDPLFQLCTKLVRESNARYAQVCVSWVSKSASSFYSIGVKGPGSQFCQNLDSETQEHKSNNVWFQIFLYGLVQRCFCKCDTLAHRKQGKCSVFRTRAIPLLEDAKKELFPTTFVSSNLVSMLELNNKTTFSNVCHGNFHMPSFLHLLKTVHSNATNKKKKTITQPKKKQKKN